MITEATPILSLLFAKGLGAKTLSQVVDRIVGEELPIGEIVSSPHDILVERYGLSQKVAAAVHASREQAARTADELAAHGVNLLIRGVEPYPRRLSDVLGDNAPPILFAKGDLSILGKRAVAICGARNASEKGIRIAAESARGLAEHDVNIVSGYARGVDLSAHTAALEAGGVTTIVLAEGILNFRAKREVKSLLNHENYLVVSEYPPRLPWSGRNAMRRNETIIGLSDAVICVESGMKGGTFAAAQSTLALNVPLFVVDYAKPAESASGNKHFLMLGATPLRGDRNGTPNLRCILSAVDGSADFCERPAIVRTFEVPVEGEQDEARSDLKELGSDDNVRLD